jgi:hypothetical protein
MGYKNNDSCLAKVADDEPIFVLRAQDVTAPMVIEFWLENALGHGAQLAPEKIAHAQECIAAMVAWPTRKFPD